MRMEFLGKKGSRRLGVAVVYDLYKTIADTNVCTDSELLEVKVPPICLGTEGASPRRDGH